MATCRWSRGALNGPSSRCVDVGVEVERRLAPLGENNQTTAGTRSRREPHQRKDGPGEGDRATRPTVWLNIVKNSSPTNF